MHLGLCVVFLREKKHSKNTLVRYTNNCIKYDKSLIQNTCYLVAALLVHYSRLAFSKLLTSAKRRVAHARFSSAGATMVASLDSSTVPTQLLLAVHVRKDRVRLVQYSIPIVYCMYIRMHALASVLPGA